jgi:uncharacterized protein
MLAKVLIALIRVYQATLSRAILALVGPVCRFEPSCSRYAVACLEGQGALRGALLSAKRLCKCHPFHPGGYDPPPPPKMGATPIPPPRLPNTPASAARSFGDLPNALGGSERHSARSPASQSGETLHRIS